MSEPVHQSTLASEVLPDAEEFLSSEMQHPVFEPMDQSNDCNLPSSLPLNYSSFPKSAQLFIDAIKRNRSLQKFFRSKLTQVEARIEENKKLKQRVKVLKNLQSSCRRITGLHLARRKDPRFKLISARRTMNSKDGVETFPLSLNHKKWTEEERKNLVNGIRQQFQEMVFQLSLDHLSGSEGSRVMQIIWMVFSHQSGIWKLPLSRFESSFQRLIGINWLPCMLRVAQVPNVKHTPSSSSQFRRHR